MWTLFWCPWATMAWEGSTPMVVCAAIALIVLCGGLVYQREDRRVQLAE